MKKVINWFKKLFGIIVIPKWDECTKSSNWTGKNASKRMMNILSPHMSEETFKERVKWIKDRGCNCVHLILANKADGEAAGYSIYGNKFDFNIDNTYTKIMTNRIKYIYKQNLGLIYWLFTDDSVSWSQIAAKNWAKYCQDIKDLGWFKYASTVVTSLETEEYFGNANTIVSLINTTRQYYKGKIGTHHVSGKYALAGASDIAFLQLEPGRSDTEITNFVKKAKTALNKPINMFELERTEDRHRSEVALAAGAFGCGNY